MSDLKSFAEWILARHARLGAVTELRALRRTESGEKSTAAGYYGPDELPQLLSDLSPVSPVPRRRIPPNDHPRVGEANFYFSLQGVDPIVAEGRRGRLTRAWETARDRDITVYTLFPIDVDPIRPAGVSSTDAEKLAALQVADRVAEWLCSKGVPPMRADSGNGFHLLVPLVPYRGSDIARAAHDAHDLLKLLDTKFSSAGARVDTGNFNPSRIFKLYGTLAVKGVSTPDRPHRLATIDLAHVPEDVDLFEVLQPDLALFRTRGKQPRASAHGPNPRPDAAPARSALPRQSPEHADLWQRWRLEALASLSLEDVYGELLTGILREGWLECRDPSSPTGDRHPSAGVADGSGSAERGTFHSFRTGDSISVFDFLMQQGRASSFREACLWIAHRTGVALPAPPERLPDPTAPFDLQAVDTFLLSLRAETDPNQKLNRIRAFLQVLASVPALEQNAALLSLHQATGLALTVLRRTLADQRREQHTKTPLTIPTGMRVLEVIRGEEALFSVFQRLVELLVPLERFYARQGSMVFIQPGGQPLPVTEGNLAGLLSGWIEVRTLQRCAGRLEVVGYEPLPPLMARTFVNNPRIRDLLPPLTTFAHAPFFASDWSFVARSGYHPVDGGVYYDGPVLKPAPHKTSALDTLLRGTPWKSPVDRVNFLGALVTALTMSHWTNGHGVVAINANREGTGKSVLAQTLALVMEGRKSTSITFEPDQAEFEKQLATRVELGERVICIDNIKLRRPVESAVLERTVTDFRPNFRRLGSNSSITREQNDLLFCLTMNRTLLGPDMRRRSLPINLHGEGASLRHPDALPDPRAWLLSHWQELVAEVAGLVVVWLEAGRPQDGTARHSTSDGWAGTIDAILRANGHTGFLSNYDSSMSTYDRDHLLMGEICREHATTEARTALGWAELLREGLLEERFKDGWGRLKSGQAQSVIVARLFQSYLHARLEVEGKVFRLVRSEPRGATHSPLFHFAAEET